METRSQPAMCQNRSLCLSECLNEHFVIMSETQIDLITCLQWMNAMTAATMAGGAHKISEIVRLYPKVAVKVGKYTLKDIEIKSIA